MKPIFKLLIPVVLVSSVLLLACSPATVTVTAPAAPAGSAASPSAAAKPPTTASPTVIKWQGQSHASTVVAPYGPFAAGQAGFFPTNRAWSDWVNKATGGRLVIEWAEPNSIFPVADMDQATAKGVVQISSGYPGVYQGRLPWTNIETGGIFFWENNSQWFEAFTKYGLYGALKNLYAKAGVRYLPQVTDAIVGIGTNFPAPGPDAIKGKKFRVTGIWADYISMLGGTPVNMPLAEMYMGVKLGTIDGWVAGAAYLEEQKMKEVTKGFVYSPNISTTTDAYLINMDAWNKLPADIQAILDRDTPFVSSALGSVWHNQCDWVIKNAAAQYGMKTYVWSDEDQQKVVKSVAEQIYPKISGTDPDSKTLMDTIILKQMRDYGRIK